MAMGGQYSTRRVVLAPGAEYAATGMSLMALSDRVHSDGAIPPRPICVLLMLVQTLTAGRLPGPLANTNHHRDLLWWLLLHYSYHPLIIVPYLIFVPYWVCYGCVTIHHHV